MNPIFKSTPIFPCDSTLFDLLPVGVMVFDADGNLLQVNRQAKAMWGGLPRRIDPGEGAFERRQALDDGDPMAHLLRPVFRTLETGEPQSQTEVTLRRPDGSRVTLLANVTPLRDERGEITGALGALTDITERARQELQARQTQALEAMGRMAGTVAHDINNLLTVINGYSEIMMHQVDESLPLHRQARGIREAGHRAAQLTRRLLAFSHQEKAVPRRIDLNEALADTEEMIRQRLPANVELGIHRPDAPLSIRADRQLVARVLMGLCERAIASMPEGGKVTIQTRHLKCDPVNSRSNGRGGRAVLVVSDTGIGMTEQALARLLEPTFSEPPGAGREAKPCLAIIYRTVEQMGGKMEVESAPGQGTRFTIGFPLHPCEPEAEEAALFTVPPPRQPTVFR